MREEVHSQLSWDQSSEHLGSAAWFNHARLQWLQSITHGFSPCQDIEFEREELGASSSNLLEWWIGFATCWDL